MNCYIGATNHAHRRENTYANPLYILNSRPLQGGRQGKEAAQWLVVTKLVDSIKKVEPRGRG